MAICPEWRNKLKTVKFLFVFPALNPRAYISCNFCKTELKARYWIIPTALYFFVTFGFLFSIGFLNKTFGISSSILFFAWIPLVVIGPLMYSFFEFDKLNLK